MTKKRISPERAAEREAVRAAELAEAQDVLSCGCPDQGFDECSVHGESGTLAEGPAEDEE